MEITVKKEKYLKKKTQILDDAREPSKLSSRNEESISLWFNCDEG